MPVKITKKDGYEVKTPGGVKAKGTTRAKAEAQKRIIEASDVKKTAFPTPAASPPQPAKRTIGPKKTVFKNPASPRRQPAKRTR